MSEHLSKDLLPLRLQVLIELARYGEQPVPEQSAKQAAHRHGALAYVECSALTQKNLKEVFDTAIVAALRSHNSGLVGSRPQTCSARPSPGSSSSSSMGLLTNGFVPFPRRRAFSLDRRTANKGKKTGWKKLCCFV